MDKQNTIENWKEARKHIEKYLDLPINAALDEIHKSSIEKPVKKILIKLLESQPNADTITSEADFSLFNISHDKNEDLSGQSIANYKLVEKIGQGGMSYVYKAKRKGAEIQKFVALKLLVSVDNELNERLQKLFTQEQLTLSKLHHSNIISFHHGGLSQNGIPYLIMEYIENAQTINEFVKNNNLRVVAIVKLIQNIAEALEYAHKNQIIHKDIKPSNILIDQLGIAKVVDFGIASFTNTSKNINTNSENIYTPDYASPEQINNKPLTASSDVFSLCAVLLELLTNKKPLPNFDINNYNPQNDVFHINTILDQSSLDKDLKNIIKKGLTPTQSQRYQSMQDLITDLTYWKELKPVSATANSLFYSAKKFIQRHKSLTLITALSFIALTFGLFYALQQKNKAQLETKKAQQVTEFLVNSIQASDPDLTKGKETSVKELLRNAKLQMQHTKFEDPTLTSSLHQTIGSALFKTGEYTEAQESLKTAINLDKNNSNARIALAKLYINQEEFKQAQRQFDILNLDTQLLTHQQQEYLRLKSKLFFNQGKFKEAQDIIEQSSLSLSKNDNKDRIENNLILAQIFNETNKYDAAIKILRQTLIDSEKQFGVLSTQSTQISHMLAKQLSNQDSTPWDEIQQLTQQTIKNEEQLYGKSHPIVAKSYLDYGFVLRMNGKLEQAEINAHKAYKIAFEKFGENHMLTAHVNVLFSQLKSLKNKLPEAITQISKALKIYHNHYGQDHYETNQLATTLSVYLVKNKQALKAIDILEPLIISQSKQLGEENKATIYSKLTLIKALVELGNLEKAISEGEKALAISEKALGKNIMLTIGTKSVLAEAYLKNKVYSKAIDYTSDLLTIDQVQKIDVNYIKISYTLLRAYIGNNEFNKAQNLQNELIKKYTQTKLAETTLFQNIMKLIIK